MGVNLICSKQWIDHAIQCRSFTGTNLDLGLDITATDYIQTAFLAIKAFDINLLQKFLIYNVLKVIALKTNQTQKNFYTHVKFVHGVIHFTIDIALTFLNPINGNLQLTAFYSFQSNYVMHKC